MNIKRCIKWYHRAHIVPLPYLVELEDGRSYLYNRYIGEWTRCYRTYYQDDIFWVSCSLLEVIVVCGTKGLPYVK